MRLSILATTAVALLFAAASARAGDLAGQVHDAHGAPAAGVLVVMEETGAEALTGADGSYRFEALDAGQHTIAIMLPGGHVQRARVNVAQEGETQRNLFMLSRDALAGMGNAELNFRADDRPAGRSAPYAVAGLDWH